MTKRKPVSKKVEAHVLVSCRRRCCLCVYLDQRDEASPGQIAHLNRDAADSRESNLVYLCLKHHDEYDSRTSQSKGFALEEVRYYKSLLIERFCREVNTWPEMPELLKVQEELIENYYDDASTYTSFKLYLTPSLFDSLYLVDKKELKRYCYNAGTVHIIHPLKGLGILPTKTDDEFDVMERSVDSYENHKTLKVDRPDTDETMTVKDWIETKTDHALRLVRDYLRYHATAADREKYPVPEIESVVDTFHSTMRDATRALVRFTFHVGKLYGCKLNKIIILCGSEIELECFMLLNKVVKETADWCDALLEWPHYDFLLLPRLEVQRSRRRSIVEERFG